MKLHLTNNAESTLAGAINETAATVLLAPGTGALFPQLANGEFFPLSLVKTSGGAPVREIVYVTARDVDSCTVLRAQEGTTASPFSAGDYAGCHPTAGCFGAKADLAGSAFTGPVSATDITATGTASLPATTFTGDVDAGDHTLKGAVMQDWGDKVKVLDIGVNVIDYRDGKYQVWQPGSGAQTLSITNWPPAGVHGELWIEGVNLGAATITLATALDFLKTDGTYVTTTSLNANQGATLQTSGIDNVLIWGRGGAPKRAKVAR